MTEVGAFDPRVFIQSVRWRPAKSMPHLPHEYVVEGKVLEEDGFWAFVAYLAEQLRHCAPPAYQFAGTGLSRCPRS